MKTTEPEVRKFLTISTSHLPSGFAERLDDQARNGRGFQDRELCLWPFAGEYGFLVYAPSERDEDRDIPDGVARLLDYARETLGCSFVLFDVDGNVLDGFGTYDNDVFGSDDAEIERRQMKTASGEKGYAEMQA